MPRPVCVHCLCEMTLDRAVTVQFNAISVGGPYQQFQGDEAVCPKCGLRIVFRYASHPCWQHFQTEKTPDVPAYIIEERQPQTLTGSITDKTPMPTEGMFRPMGAAPMDEDLVLAFMADVKAGANAAYVRQFLRPSSQAAMDEAVRRIKEESGT